MKKKWQTWMLLLCIGLTTQGIAQTNTFPSSGNVGLGTTSPLEKLHIENGELFIENSDQHILSELNSNSDYSRLIFNSSDNYLISYGASHNSDAHKIALKANHSSSSIGLFTNSNERLIVDSLGNVGIGTTNPEEQLHIAGNALISNERKFYFSRGNDSNDSGSIRYNNPYYNIGWDWPEKHERAMVFKSYGILDSHGAGGGGYLFKTKNGSGTKFNALTIRRDGRIGVGTLKPTAKFTVNGKVKAKEIIVEEDIGADFVFEDGYDLPKLKEVESYIQKKNHLQGIPSAAEMKKNGVKIGELQMKLLQKIEELTLYVIKLEKKVRKLEK